MKIGLVFLALWAEYAKSLEPDDVTENPLTPQEKESEDDLQYRTFFSKHESPSHNPHPNPTQPPPYPNYDSQLYSKQHCKTHHEQQPSCHKACPGGFIEHRIDGCYCCYEKVHKYCEKISSNPFYDTCCKHHNDIKPPYQYNEAYGKPHTQGHHPGKFNTIQGHHNKFEHGHKNDHHAHSHPNFQQPHVVNHPVSSYPNNWDNHNDGKHDKAGTYPTHHQKYLSEIDHHHHGKVDNSYGEIGDEVPFDFHEHEDVTHNEQFKNSVHCGGGKLFKRGNKLCCCLQRKDHHCWKCLILHKITASKDPRHHQNSHTKTTNPPPYYSPPTKDPYHSTTPIPYYPPYHPQAKESFYPPEKDSHHVTTSAPYYPPSTTEAYPQTQAPYHPKTPESHHPSHHPSHHQHSHQHHKNEQFPVHKPSPNYPVNNDPYYPPTKVPYYTSTPAPNHPHAKKKHAKSILGQVPIFDLGKKKIKRKNAERDLRHEEKSFENNILHGDIQHTNLNNPGDSIRILIPTEKTTGLRSRLEQKVVQRRASATLRRTRPDIGLAQLRISHPEGPGDEHGKATVWLSGGQDGGQYEIYVGPHRECGTNQHFSRPLTQGLILGNDKANQVDLTESHLERLQGKPITVLQRDNDGKSSAYACGTLYVHAAALLPRIKLPKLKLHF